MSSLLDPNNSPNAATLKTSLVSRRPLFAAIVIGALTALSLIFFIAPRAHEGKAQAGEETYFYSASAPDLGWRRETSDDQGFDGGIEDLDEYEEDIPTRTYYQRSVPAGSGARSYQLQNQASQVYDYRNKLFENALVRLNSSESVDSSSETPPPPERTVGPYLMAGAVIPGVLQTGINSDLKGMIIGRVTRNVFDTATGEHLLIPAGTRIVGSYDEALVVGQQRVLLSWRRLIFPDGSSIDLGDMGGHDTQGFSGLADQVDNHYGRIFGAAILLSLVGAGYQMSQPQTGGDLSSGDILSAEIGRNFHQASAQMIQRDMQIKPTIRIRQGMKFLILVNKDLSISEWRW